MEYEHEGRISESRISIGVRKVREVVEGKGDSGVYWEIMSVLVIMKTK